MVLLINTFPQPPPQSSKMQNYHFINSYVAQNPPVKYH